MPNKFREIGTVVTQECIAPDIYSLWLKADAIAAAARPGQFVSVYCHDKSRLLPRPISICEALPDRGWLRIVYRIAGKGTDEFSRLREGETVTLLGPLGNGFPLDRCPKGKTALLFGGGIGIPPMVELAKQLPGEAKIVVGYRDANTFLRSDLSLQGEVYIATEDGSVGAKGNVLDAVREYGLTADVIYACGPTPMLRALKAWAAEKDIECWLSLEERMACGVGACLGCVCRSTEIDGHSLVHNKRICKDGPVFLSTEVEL